MYAHEGKNQFHQLLGYMNLLLKNQAIAATCYSYTKQTNCNLCENFQCKRSEQFVNESD